MSSRLRPFPIALALIAAGFVVAGLGGLGMVLAQEAPKAVETGRDYSIGTLGPQPSAKAPPAPGDEPDAAAADDENVTAVTAVDPQKRPRYGAAILQAVDKVTAETLRFEARVGEPIRFKGLVVTVNACETTAGDEDAPDSIAHLSVLSQPEGLTTAAARDAYRGWMYANGPAVHPFAHPVYDLWLIACKASAPSAAAAMR